jgi:hypothetical protein
MWIEYPDWSTGWFAVAVSVAVSCDHSAALSVVSVTVQPARLTRTVFDVAAGDDGGALGLAGPTYATKSRSALAHAIDAVHVLPVEQAA